MCKISGSHEICSEFVKALGLVPDRVASFKLIMDPNDIVKAEVTLLLEDTQLKMAAEVLKDFELVEKEKE